jgi:hypothetical protein
MKAGGQGEEHTVLDFTEARQVQEEKFQSP